nr:12543_t:CDS:2 [Entrophospora candida]
MSNSNANNLNNDSSNNDSQTTVVIPPFLSDAQNLDEATLTNKFKQLHMNDQERQRKAEDQVNKYSMSVALDPNVSKYNRYSNVLPFNYNRVKLIRKRPGRTDDYINASYIRAPYDVKKYIVTQGPMKNTLEDFWLMIWEQNSKVIVMLTKEQEKNIIKCDKYWPDLGSPVIYKNSGLKVELEKEDLDPSTTCVIRTIRIEKIDDYFYSDIDLLNNNINSYSVNSVVLHCSAGCGRTDLVGYFREQRVIMVQTLGQFQYCYLAVLSNLVCKR